MSSFNVSFPGLGIENIPINRAAFSIFGLTVYWYGLLIATAVLLSVYLALRHAKQFSMVQDDILDTYIILTPAIIIFSRLYYVAFAWHEFADDWLKIFNTRQGGLAFYGGVIGGILTFAVVCKYKKRRLADWMDFFVVYLPLGQAIGRWGNFFNQEAFGDNTTMPWGMISEGTKSYLSVVNIAGVDPNLPVHPTFLYEFIGNMIIFVLLYYVRKNTRFHLETMAWYFMSYGCLRFFVESIRTDALFIGNSGIRVSMLLSFLMFIFALVYLVVAYYKLQKGQLKPSCLKEWTSDKILKI